MGYGTTISLTITDCEKHIQRIVDIATESSKQLLSKAGTPDERGGVIHRFQITEAEHTLEVIKEQKFQIVPGSYAQSGITFTTQYKNLITTDYVRFLRSFFYDVLETDDILTKIFLIIDEEQKVPRVHYFSMEEDGRGMVEQIRDFDRFDYSAFSHSLTLNKKDWGLIFTLLRKADAELDENSNDGFETKTRLNEVIYKLLDSPNQIMVDMIRKIMER